MWFTNKIKIRRVFLGSSIMTMMMMIVMGNGNEEIRNTRARFKGVVCNFFSGLNFYIFHQNIIVYILYKYMHNFYIFLVFWVVMRFGSTYTYDPKKKSLFCLFENTTTNAEKPTKKMYKNFAWNEWVAKMFYRKMNVQKKKMMMLMIMVWYFGMKMVVKRDEKVFIIQ